MGAAAVILAAIWIACAWNVYRLDARSSAIAQTRATRLAAEYANDVSADLVIVDNVLNFVAAYDSENGIDRSAVLVERNRLASGILSGIVIVDRTGKGRFAGLGQAAPTFIGDRAHFRAALAARSPEMIIGRALTGRQSGQIAIPFARPVRDSGGRTVGVVSTAVPASTFVAGYDEHDLYGHGTISMVDTSDRVVLSRYIVGSQSAGRAVTNSKGFWDRVAAAPIGFYWQQSSSDGLTRAYAYRRLSSYPIVVVAGLAYVDIADEVGDVRRNILLTGGGATIVVLVILFAWLRQIEARRRIDAAMIRAEAASRAKGEFLANMSHEIRTPMNGVLGMINLVLKTNLSEKQRDYLIKANASASNLLAIINDILDVSKIESGKFELDQIPFNLSFVLRDVCVLAEVRAEEKAIAFRVERDADLAQDFIGDPLRLGQVLLNVVGNAIKFTERGEVVLGVKLARRGSRRDYVQFTIRDTGIGMTPEQQGRLFQAFNQADSTIARRFGGSGLGLAISKSFVDMMGGTISVESLAGVGTIFTIGVPLERSDAAPTVAPADEVPHARTGAKELAGIRVLVAEDNAINREIVVGLLADAGAETECVENGGLAVAAVLDRPGRFDVVLMDVQMPVVDGLEATRRIRRRIGAATLPIIAMTAHVMDDERRRCLDAGMNDHVGKPIDPFLLIATVERWTRKGTGPALAPRTGGPRAESTLANELPGFDVAGALEGVLGDEAFLRRLFAEFHRDFHDVAAELRVLQAGGDLANAAMRAHSLAGVAGQLGADGVYRTACSLERALRTGDTETAAALTDTLETELDAAIAALRALSTS